MPLPDAIRDAQRKAAYDLVVIVRSKVEAALAVLHNAEGYARSGYFDESRARFSSVAKIFEDAARIVRAQIGED